MAGITTPRVRLSLHEFVDLLPGLCVVSGTILKLILFTSPSWHLFQRVLPFPFPLKSRRPHPQPRPQGSGSRSERKRQEEREYWRKICIALIRAGGDRFSIRQLQYMMPNTTQLVRVWSRIRGVNLKTEVVRTSTSNTSNTLLPDVDADADVDVDLNAPCPAPAVHWLGGFPGEDGLQDDERVLVYIHGGGFVLPMSHGHFELLCYIRKQMKSGLSCAVYIAAVEYTIAPYSRHPVQLIQVLRSLSYLMERYHIPPSSCILAGDSCGAGLCISTLSHFLHPHPSMSTPHSPTLRNRLPSPFAGVLLFSPWTSFATTAASFRENSARDSLTPTMIRRYRDTFINGTSLLPATSEADAWSCSLTRGDSLAPTDAEDDPVLLEPLIPWNGDKRRGYWLRPTEAPFDWWAGIEEVTSKVMITAGMFECFRDDILSFEGKLRLLMRRDGSGPALEVSSFLDSAVHATLVNDFAFGIEPGEQMDCVINWLKRAFQPQG